MSRDLVVVGGGPAGMGCAIAARRAGLRVTVLERAAPPVDKACGEGLMPAAVARLTAWGVAPPGRPFTGIRYLRPGVVAEGRFPGGPGLGVRRVALHRALAERAAELGADLRWRNPVHGLVPGGVETDRGPVTAPWVVGADGLHSRVRRWAGLAGPLPRRPRYGVRRHFRVVPWCEAVEVHWGAGVEAYVTPVAADEVGVALLWRGEAATFDALLPRFPELRTRLRGAPAASRDRGAGAFRQRVPRATRGRLALIGDAGGYVDPIAGEGLDLAFAEAEAVVEAISGGDLEGFERVRRRLRRLPEAVTRLLLVAERYPPLAGRLVRTRAADPVLFDRLLALLAGERGAGAVAPAAGRLAWGLATGR